MNINITYNKERNYWQYVEVCDRCKKSFANLIKADRKPTENEICICQACVLKMFSNERNRDCWISPKDKLPTEGQEVEFIATYSHVCGTPYRQRFQGHFRQVELGNFHVMIFYAHSIGWGCEFAIDEVEYWMPKVPMPEEKK